MSFNQLLNQFLGTSNPQDATPQNGTIGLSSSMGKISSHIPGGLAGGAAAGGIVALLMSSKSARKFAGKAATYGGAAVLGGLAFKAYKNWQQNNTSAQNQAASSAAHSEVEFHQQALASKQTQNGPFELSIIKAMIAAARADGHIDAAEQRRIFEAVDKLELSAEHKGILFDYLQRDIPIAELVTGIHNIELKSEIYLASCLVIEADHPAERTHLNQLAQALALPGELTRQLEIQAQQAFSAAA